MESRWPCQLLDNLGLEKEEVRTSDGGCYPEADSGGSGSDPTDNRPLLPPLRGSRVSPRGARLDIQRISSRSCSLVWNNRGGHSFHAHDRCGMSFPGIYHLRGEHHLNDIHPHHGNQNKESVTIKDLTALVAAVLRRISFLFGSFRGFFRLTGACMAPPTRRTGNLPTACL